MWTTSRIQCLNTFYLQKILVHPKNSGKNPKNSKKIRKIWKKSKNFIEDFKSAHLIPECTTPRDNVISSTYWSSSLDTWTSRDQTEQNGQILSKTSLLVTILTTNSSDTRIATIWLTSRVPIEARACSRNESKDPRIKWSTSSGKNKLQSPKILGNSIQFKWKQEIKNLIDGRHVVAEGRTLRWSACLPGCQRMRRSETPSVRFWAKVPSVTFLVITGSRKWASLKATKAPASAPHASLTLRRSKSHQTRIALFWPFIIRLNERFNNFYK